MIIFHFWIENCALPPFSHRLQSCKTEQLWSDGLWTRTENVWIIKRASIIILAIKLCEEHNVCVLPWLTDVGENEGLSGEPWSMALHCSTLSALLLRLCKYIPFLPYDTRIRRLWEVNHWLNACISGKTPEYPEDRWSKLLLQLFVSSATI